MQTFHGTVVDIAGVGVLLQGPSGRGKSDLALRLIDRGATLVADDRYELRASSRGVIASAPERLYGLLEVRGLGILSVPAIKTTVVRLVVELVNSDTVPRLPEKSTTGLCGRKITCFALNAFEQTTAIKIELAASNLNRIGQVGRQDE